MLDFKDVTNRHQASLKDFSIDPKMVAYFVHTTKESIQKRAISKPKFFVIRLNKMHPLLSSRCNIADVSGLKKKKRIKILVRITYVDKGESHHPIIVTYI